MDTPKEVFRLRIVQFLFLAVVTTSIMWFAGDAPRDLLVAAVVWVLAALIVVGRPVRGKPWAIPLEVVPHAAGVVIGVLFMQRGEDQVVLWGTVAAGAISLGLLAGMRGGERRVEPAP